MRIRFTVPKGKAVPSPGTSVSVPVEGDWLELGLIDSGKILPPHDVSVTLLLDPAIATTAVLDPPLLTVDADGEELLRRLVVDFYERCDNHDSCACSVAAASRYLRRRGVTV